MKRSIHILAILVALTALGAKPAEAQNRYIVQTTGGLSSVLNLCSLLGCQVQGSLDGNVGQTFLVTTTGNLVTGILTVVEQLLGIVSIETDQVLHVPTVTASTVPSGLYDSAPGNYYGTIAWHGYAAQPAAEIVRLQDAQNGFAVSGKGIVAVID